MSGGSETTGAARPQGSGDKPDARGAASTRPEPDHRETATGTEPGAGAILRVRDIGLDDARALLTRHGLRLEHVADGCPIPGSFWGEPEAGVIGDRVYVRSDTPVHSMLHEACHLIVLSPERRATVHTDASDSIDEEDAACYLQIVLAGALPGVGSDSLMRDMDAWGYSFRLGSARAWFERDAENARLWLAERRLLPG